MNRLFKIHIFSLSFIIIYTTLLFQLNVHKSDHLSALLIIQFLIGFLPNLWDRKMGRILTIVGVLCNPFLGIIFNEQNSSVFAIFFGSISGIIFRSILVTLLETKEKSEDFFLNYISKNKLELNQKKIYMPYSFGMIVFFSFLLLERFIVYFNAPFIKKFGVMDTMFLPNVTSWEAFGHSVYTLSIFLFPLLYFLTEDLTTGHFTKPTKEWLEGLFIGILTSQIGFFVLQQTNDNQLNTILFNSWVYSISFFVFLWYIKNKNWKRSTKIVLNTFLFTIFFAIGFSTEPFYWIIFYIGSLIIFHVYIFHQKISLQLKLIFTFVLNLFMLFYLLILPRIIPIQSQTPTLNYLIQMFLSSTNPIQSSIQNWKNLLDIIEHFSKIFGNGIGSLLFEKIIPSQNPNGLYQFLMIEIGIFGTLIIFLWIFFEFISRKIYFLASILLLALLYNSGYQNPVNGFLLTFILLGTADYRHHFHRYTIYSFQLLCIMIGTFFISHSFYLINQEPLIPEFRYEFLKKYQLSATKKFQRNKNISYYQFKGKNAWVLGSKKRINLKVFLNSENSKEKIFLKWEFFDKNWNLLTINNSLISNNQSIQSLNLIVPKNAKFLQMREVRENGSYKYRPNFISILSTNFDSLNRIK